MDAMDTDATAAEDIASGGASGFDVRRQDTAGDFELVDDGEEGKSLEGREGWPVCVTMNVVGVPFFICFIPLFRSSFPRVPVLRCLQASISCTY